MECIATVGTTALKENRIEGVMNVNRVWLIPKDAKKPVDARLKTVCLQKEGKI